MTTATFPAHATFGRTPAEASQPGALTLLLEGLADGWRAWRDYLTLSATGDAELARLGIARDDIARHAVLGRTSR